MSKCLVKEKKFVVPFVSLATVISELGHTVMNFTTFINNLILRSSFVKVFGNCYFIFNIDINTIHLVTILSVKILQTIDITVLLLVVAQHLF